jgi:PAS domain S-box-containing protein
MIGEDRARVQPDDLRFDASSLQRAIFNSENFSSIATDAKGVIQIFNVGAERMLGYAAAEVTNRITPAEICDPEEMVARARALSAEMGTHIEPGFDALSFKASRGIEDMYELTYVRKDGSQFPAAVSVTALRDGEGAIIGYLLIGTDNTTRKNLQEERLRLDQRLRDQHFYTRSLIESNIDAMITTDPRGIITDVNNQAQALTECTRDELIGSPFKKHFTDPHRAEGCINLVLGQAKIINYELTARTRAGRAIQVSCNASTFCDRERRLLGVFVAARDVTEAKSLEQLLQQKNAELVESSRIKSEFLANMSHELRTPLNAIIGFSEVLRDGLLGEITEEQRGFVGDIFESGQHLLSLISDILDLSKVESGKMMLDLEEVKVSSLFVNCLSIIGEKAASRRIALQIRPTDELGAVQVDVRKVKQILYNLLSNAVKFTSEGGRVALQVRRVPRAEVGTLSGPWTGRNLVVDAVVDDSVGEFLELSVTDSGIGISREGLEHLFEPFSQIDSGLARKYVGTGLGLVMVRLLSELHGGGVAVTSAPGEGSCFTVWLPFRTEGQALQSSQTPGPLALEGHRAARIAMMVGSDLDSANRIRVQLEAEGFEVLHAASADAAVTLALQQPLALIALDNVLPSMAGWQFLRRLKQMPALTRIPVVIASSTAERDKGFARGPSAIVPPLDFDPVRFKGEVRRAMGSC